MTRIIWPFALTSLLALMPGCPQADPDGTNPGSAVLAGTIDAGERPAPDAAAAGPEGVSLSAEALFAAYRDDEEKAARDYGDRRVEVSGEIVGIDKNLRRQHLVSLAAGGGDTVLAILAMAESSRAVYLRPGDDVRVAGKCAGKGWSTVEVHEATLLGPVDTTRLPAEGRMDGDVFVRPDLGFRLPLPSGWRHDAAFLGGLVQSFEVQKPSPGVFRYPANVTVVQFEAPGQTLDAQMTLVREGLVAREDTEILDSGIIEVSGEPAAWIAYVRGAGSMRAFEVACTLARGKQFIRIVGSGAAERAEHYRALFSEMMGAMTWKLP